MDTVSSSSIQYTGKVTVTVKKSQQIISSSTVCNAGTNILFNALCVCLCGDRSGLSTMPYFIDAGTGSASTYYSLLQVPSLITRKFPVYDSSQNMYVAQFVCTISYSQLSKQGEPITELRLLSSSKDVLASVTFSEGINIENSSFTAVVQWEMSFSNPIS